jgi:hypothetical protein
VNKLYNFYHLWVDGNWKSPLNDHISYLEDSLLYGNIEKVYVGLVGSASNRITAKEYLRLNAGTKYEVCVEADSGFEQVTQDAMVDFAKDHDGYVFYNHAKAAHNDVEFDHAWRKELYSVLVGQWRKCVRKLKEHSMVGTYYLMPKHTAAEYRLKDSDDIKYARFIGNEVWEEKGHFSSNFWWTHLKYIKALGYPDRVETTTDPYLKYADDRLAAEVWTKGMKLAVESIGDKYSIYDMHKGFLFKSLDLPRPEEYNQSIDKAYLAKTYPKIVWPYTNDPDWN